jgi:hypothetical protein
MVTTKNIHACLIFLAGMGGATAHAAGRNKRIAYRSISLVVKPPDTSQKNVAQYHKKNSTVSVQKRLEPSRCLICSHVFWNTQAATNNITAILFRLLLSGIVTTLATNVAKSIFGPTDSGISFKCWNIINRY